MSGVLNTLLAGGFAKTNTYTSGSGTETIPNGATHVIITVNGGGGGGGISNGGHGGGGGGAQCIKTLALTSSNWGQTFTYTVATIAGRKTNAGSTATGNAGSASTVANGTFPTSVSMNAGAGVAGSNLADGAGGTATGGDTNTAGAAGSAGNGGQGAGTIGGAGGITGTTQNAADGTQPGGGGAGETVASALDGGQGAAGTISFKYT